MDINVKIQPTVPQNDMPKSLISSGIISEMTKKGNVRTAHDAINITKLNDATGTQLNASTSYCHDFNITKVPNVINPNAAPIEETANKN